MSIAEELRQKYARDLPPRSQEIASLEKARDQWRGRIADLIAEVVRREAIDAAVIERAADGEREAVRAKVESIMADLRQEVELAHLSVEGLEQEIIRQKEPKK